MCIHITSERVVDDCGCIVVCVWVCCKYSSWIYAYIYIYIHIALCMFAFYNEWYKEPLLLLLPFFVVVVGIAVANTATAAIVIVLMRHIYFQSRTFSYAFGSNFLSFILSLLSFARIFSACTHSIWRFGAIFFLLFSFSRIHSILFALQRFYIICTHSNFQMDCLCVRSE